MVRLRRRLPFQKSPSIQRQPPQLLKDSMNFSLYIPPFINPNQKNRVIKQFNYPEYFKYVMERLLNVLVFKYITIIEMDIYLNVNKSYSWPRVARSQGGRSGLHNRGCKLTPPSPFPVPASFLPALPLSLPAVHAPRSVRRSCCGRGWRRWRDRRVAG